MRPSKTTLLAVLATAGLLIVVGSVAAQPSPQPPADEAKILAGVTPVPATISYQGRLTDGLGAPLGGHYSMVFQFWTDDAAGAQVGPDVVLDDVLVDEGLFTVVLAAPTDALTGQALWLRIQVNGRWLSPRQPLLPVPYALSLWPGAQVKGGRPRRQPPSLRRRARPGYGRGRPP